MRNSRQFLKFIGGNIRYFRHLRGFSQEKLAVRASLSSEYISRVEQGKKNICADTVFRISKALDIDPQKLFQSHPIKQNDER